eukprot:TRINITY_DN15712_c0_g1_i1.p1 TRINITY_DN15712_c0_g1~~TRINITY_DN15712_c0_g1_i1.p1  ORF type:complete len:257 (+),score=64.40 TRINITY_DN15712_c0_g1_i1:40-771(+)
MSTPTNKGLVIVTGASSGIGVSCAQLFSQHGHPLLLIGRRLERMQSLQLPHTLCEPVDVTDLAAVTAAVKKAEQQFGPPECLINNAGVMHLGGADTQDPTEWQRMLDVNVMGVLNCIKAVIDGMRDRQSGTIINVSSVAGRKTFGTHAVYCATKFGVHALTETFREEFAPHNVKFVVIAPGIVETELLSHTTDLAIKASYEKVKTTMETLIPEDVANACWFAFAQPRRCCIREIVLAPTMQKG